MAGTGDARGGGRISVAIAAAIAGMLMILLALPRLTACLSIVSWSGLTTLAPMPGMSAGEIGETLAAYRRASAIVPGDAGINQTVALAATRLGRMSGNDGDLARLAVEAAEAAAGQAPSRAYAWSLVAMTRSQGTGRPGADVELPLRLSYGLGPYEAIDFVPRLSAALMRWPDLPDDLRTGAARDARRLWLLYPAKDIFASVYLDAGLEGREVLRSVVTAMEARNVVALDKAVTAAWRERRAGAIPQP
jgi:hypothetical protein